MTPSGPTSRLARAAPWLALAAILAGTAVAYLPALPGPFVLDDWGSIESNMALRRPGAVRIPSLPEMLGPGRPVTETTFALDFRAVGLEPFRYHLVGLLLHLGVVVAAYAFLSSLLRRSGHPRPRGVALAVAGLLALHPIQAESVAYAAQRSEVLAALLVLLSLALLDRAAATGLGWRGAASWAGGGVAWILAMGAKTTAIAMPGIFLLDRAVVAPADERGARRLGRRTSRALLLAAPLLPLAAWSAVLHLRHFESAPGGGVGSAGAGLPTGAYLLTQLRVVWLYLRLLAWPDALALDRSFVPSRGVDGPVLLAGAGIAAALLLAGWLWLRAERADGPRPAHRLAAFGILFWFAALAPTSSVIPVIDLAVEHRVYLACLGPFLAVVVGLDALLFQFLQPGNARRAGAVLAAGVFALLGVALAGRARIWSSAESLWEASARASPGNARAWTNLGLARARRGNLVGAEAAYRKGWGVVADPARAASLGRNYSAVLLEMGRADEALAVVDRALVVAPGESSLFANRAAALSRMGRNDEAVVEARRAVQAAPGDPLMRNVLGSALTMVGDWQGALAEFQTAEAIDPGNPAYGVAAAVSLSALGRREEACAAFHRAWATTRARPLPFDAARRAAALGCPLPVP